MAVADEARSRDAIVVDVCNLEGDEPERAEPRISAPFVLELDAAARARPARLGADAQRALAAPARRGTSSARPPPP